MQFNVISYVQSDVTAKSTFRKNYYYYIYDNYSSSKTKSEKSYEKVGLGMQIGFGIRHVITPGFMLQSKVSLLNSPYLKKQNVYNFNANGIDGMFEISFVGRIPGSFTKNFKKDKL